MNKHFTKISNRKQELKLKV